MPYSGFINCSTISLPKPSYAGGLMNNFLSSWVGFSCRPRLHIVCTGFSLLRSGQCLKQLFGESLDRRGLGHNVNCRCVAVVLGN